MSVKFSTWRTRTGDTAYPPSFEMTQKKTGRAEFQVSDISAPCTATSWCCRTRDCKSFTSYFL